MSKKATRHQPDVDPVSGKRINRNRAHIVMEYKGKSNHLCCPLSQAEFERAPEKYASR